jgi:uncharacterized membrane protein (DUF485 family)
MTDFDHAAARLSRKRWLIAGILSALMMVCYFGFLLLVAFNKPLLALLISKGLNVGIPLGAGVIVSAWLLTLVYIRWANTHYDEALLRLKKSSQE